MFERFVKDARRVVIHASQVEAQALCSPTIEAEHLLLALAADEATPAARLLAENGLDHDGVRIALERETERSLAAVGVGVGDYALPDKPTAPRRSPKFAASSKRALERAVRLASARRDRHVGASHLLLGILHADVGTVPRALAAVDVDRVALVTRAERLLD
jgi:ATP-dependent Clp protease ATP-binding subunit ClpA